jgi:hypothetical protein
MPTQPYFNEAGVRLPGVTTVIGSSLGWSKDGLKHWAWQLGKEGKDYRDFSNKAADIGTLAHAMVEGQLKGVDWKTLVNKIEWTDDQEADAVTAFNAYAQWARQTRLEILESEVMVISEKLQTGGTIDAVGEIEGKKCLLDWKTSNGTYPDHLIQIAAYGAIYTEARGEPLDGGFHLLRFGKTAPTFVHHFWPTAVLDDAFQAFTWCRALYDKKKRLEALAK